MAAQIDWVSVIKPILNTQYGVIAKEDVINIIAAILKSKSEILEHDEVYEPFFTSFATIAVDIISSQISSRKLETVNPKEDIQMPQIIEACLILMRYIVSRLEKIPLAEAIWFLPALKSLCDGKSPGQTFDHHVLVAILRNAKHPECPKSTTASENKESPKSDTKVPPSNLSMEILQQLTTPLGHTTSAIWAPLGVEIADANQSLVNANISNMQIINAADTILRVCNSLPILSRYFNRYEESVIQNRALFLPILNLDAVVIKNCLPALSSDIMNVSMALSLPIFDSLTPNKIQQLSQIGISAIYCALLASITLSSLTVSSISSQKTSAGGQQQTVQNTTSTQSTAKESEETTEDCARQIVDKGLEIFSAVGNIFKTSAKNHIYQNHICIGAWILVTGIQSAMGASGGTTAQKGQPTTEENRTKGQGQQKQQQKADDVNESKTKAPIVPPKKDAKDSETISEDNKSKGGKTTQFTEDVKDTKQRTQFSSGEELKSKSPSRLCDQSSSGRISFIKVQQGFGVLNAAIAKHCLGLLTELIDDLKIESRTGDDHIDILANMEPAGFDILYQHTALQRILRVMGTTSLQQVLTVLATVSYRKACSLKRINIKNDGDQVSYSDSTTYFNDTFSCSDASETEEEEDSESYLGLWFKETLAPETNEEKVETNTDKQNDSKRNTPMVSVKDEPHEYLELSAHIFMFLDTLLGSNNKYLNRYVKTGLSEQQMLLLANIIKDLDRDSSRSEPEGSCHQWQNAMLKFAGAVGRYLHNLISGGLIDESLQSSLLLYLGVSPWQTDTRNWQLQIYPRTLSILAQVLLLKPSQEKEAACLSIWQRMINTLVEGVCINFKPVGLIIPDPEGDTEMRRDSKHVDTSKETEIQEKSRSRQSIKGKTDKERKETGEKKVDIRHENESQLPDTGFVQQNSDESEDLNVEHAQLLLYLFHNLSLMQKKSILLLTAGGVIRCAEVCRNIRSTDDHLKDSQLILLSRLLLLLEYIMKHLYYAPDQLLEQVRWNLFNVIANDSSQSSNDISNISKMMSFCRQDIEDKYRKHSADAVNSIRPKFYTLTTPNKDVLAEFKLDGLAWNFILCTPDKLKYPLLVDALIDILSVADICEPKTAFSTMCLINYCFNLTWKLLLGLPPSTTHVETLMDDKIPNLHSLVWSLKCLNPHPAAHNLIVNSLVKQGMYTQYAETLWSKLTEHVANQIVSINITNAGIEAFLKYIQNRVTPANADEEYTTLPGLSKILLIDALVSHLYALCTVWEGTTKTTNTTDTNSGSSQNSNDKKSSSPNSPVSEASSLTISSSDSSVSGTLTQPQQPTVTTTDVKFNERNENCVKLLNNLIDLVEVLRKLIFGILSKNLSGSISKSMLDSLISISGTKYNFCADISRNFSTWVTGPDREMILVEWRKNIVINEDEILNSNIASVEIYTQKVIEAHLNEIYKYPSYSIVLSLKHTLKSTVSLIEFVLTHQLRNHEHKLNDRLKDILIPLLFDLRTEYLHAPVESALMYIVKGYNIHLEPFLNPCHGHLLKCSYKLLLDYCESSATVKHTEFNEAVTHDILAFWESMIESTGGMKTLRKFFYETKQGNLCSILMSFTNTSLSQMYATKVLNFFETLFQAAEKPDSDFTIEELCSCLSDLGAMDTNKMKNWLTHILLGPGANTSSSSTSSSNVQTPTNMATISAVPSITDQVVPSSDPTNGVTSSVPVAVNSTDPDAMEIEEDIWPFANTVTTNRSPNDSPNEEVIEENGSLLQSLTKYLVSQNRISTEVSSSLFQALIQLGQVILNPSQDAIDFTDLLQVMIILADAAKTKGHFMLFNAAVEWLDTSKYLVLDKISSNKNTRTGIAVENMAAILRYMGDLLQGIGFVGSRQVIAQWEKEQTNDIDEFVDEVAGEDDDSVVEDSDEDSLSNKLCTYSITQKEFMNQHWYHCHTCRMVDGVGVCSVCARVCHKNHDVSYSKYGNFFCDCGAKEDGSCLAMQRRTTTSGNSGRETTANQGVIESSSNIDQLMNSSIRKRNSAPMIKSMPSSVSNEFNLSPSERVLQITKVIDTAKDTLIVSDKWKLVVKCLLDFFNDLIPAVRENCAKYSVVGCHLRAKNALERLHMPSKTFAVSDQIMIATLGSQEGAFENVRMNYSGEQGQTIRQLLSTNLLRRVALCCLASPHGKRQHLAVSHDKGKVTILQLSALLKQADAARRKLTLTKVASAPIPCTIISLAANPANEDYLAVCGLKECHILTFNSSGTTNDHIVLTAQFETGNFIRRAIWLPSSQTKLALVTADYVKIYDLAEDSYSPQYYFLMPSGKIIDCTFVYQEGTYYMLLIASSGYIYTQPLAEESLAKHGAFYVTSTLELDIPQLKDVNGQIGNGGVSIYYSHVLQMLFFSYSQGKSFMAPLVDVNAGVKCIMPLHTSPSPKTGTKTPPQQPLVQWTEIIGHPGLICAMMQTSNHPVIFMIKPDGVMMQEIKAYCSKAKIMDMVAIRHTVSGVEKTTLILLCEDGSLRIYVAHPENTGYWLSPEIQPIGNHIISSFAKNKKIKKNNSRSTNSSATGVKTPVGNPVFPIDFFEHCTAMNEVEYGGNDLLQIYNTQQLKNRLNSTGLYVVSTKPQGFNLEVINNDMNMVITGIRILIGSQDPKRAPICVAIHGRTVQTVATRSRWFDIPLTREESLQSDKKLVISFGPSQDPDNICMLDSIKVYGKTKDIFGWPDESEETASTSLTGPSNANLSLPGIASGTVSDINTQRLTPIDKMVSNMLEVLDCGLNLIGGNKTIDDPIRTKAIEIATTLLLLPTPAQVQIQAKCVLATLHGNKAAYHAYKDKEILAEVNNQSIEMQFIVDPRDIDPEEFYRLILLVRSIAISRPYSLAKISIENDYSSFLPATMMLMRRLHRITPGIEEQCSIVKQGLSHTESVVYSLVEIVYAFGLASTVMIELMTSIFIELLLDTSPIISHSAKQAMIKLLRPRVKRRKVVIGSPTICSTPRGTEAQAGTSGAASSLTQDSQQSANDSNQIQENNQLMAGAEAAAAGVPNFENLDQFHDMASLEALLGMAGMPQLIDLHQDADEEAIMEIAIALSLQEQENIMQGMQGALPALQMIRNRQPQSLQNAANAGPQFQSDAAITSGGGSDDEGSNAATDGSTLRTSPAEPAGSGGSESGGSGVESIGGISGRSSTYGDQIQQGNSPQQTESQTQTTERIPIAEETKAAEEQEDQTETENATRLHDLRTSILSEMVDKFKSMDNSTGQQAIPFMQVILMLTCDLDVSQPKDMEVLVKLISTIIDRLSIVKDVQNVVKDLPLNPTSEDEPLGLLTRSSNTEVQIVLLRFLGVLMGRVKYTSKSTNAISKENAAVIGVITATMLMESGAIPHCLVILKSFLPYWQNSSNNDDAPVDVNTVPIAFGLGPPNHLLKPTNYGPEPDLQPFFIPQTSKGCTDVFELYPQVLTEMAVRLPYQIFKLSTKPGNQFPWYSSLCEQLGFVLCEYMMVNQIPVLLRQVRKLLMYICGNKEKYRQMRDIYSLDVHMKIIKKCCEIPATGSSAPIVAPVLSYDALVKLMEHLRICQDTVAIHTGNWQQFCLTHTEILAILMRISTYQLDDGVSPIILQLLQAAVCNPNTNPTYQVKGESRSTQSRSVRTEREKSEEGDTTDLKFDAAHCPTLVSQIFNQLPVNLITKFMRIFLLETNISSIRWQAHSLIYGFYEHSNTAQKELLLKCMWDLWPLLPVYGRRTAQFVDLIGFLTLSTKSISDALPQYMGQAVSVLRQQNELLSKHPNAPIYTALAQVLEIDGFYLESEPCLICNNPEVPMSNIKLSTIKIDSKFTTQTTIVKLIQSHIISKIVLRIGDLKRAKMVRTMYIYYNNRTVQAVVELKNRPSMWHKAKKVRLAAGQTDVKIDFVLPITACNLMIEYYDFYETVTGSSESLQCPRCSAPVPANPGICGNCGENVFQCHKCRAINYDEKDPFLCHSCGFCKYAKFDYSIIGRACCAVDPIESADDRAKTVQTIHTSLDKADRIYRQLQANKQILELLVQKVSEQKLDRTFDESLSGGVVGGSQVNKVIQLLAQKYAVDSKSSFEELGKIIQKIQACRRELVSYDRSQLDLPAAPSESTIQHNQIAINKCYGCALASTEQCLTLLRAMASNMECRKELCNEGLVEELAQNNLRRGTVQIQDEVRQLMCLLTRDLPDATKKLCDLIKNRVKLALSGVVPLANLDSAVRHEMALLEALVIQYDSCWEEKLKVVFELFLLSTKDLRGPAVAVMQPALRILESIITPPIPKSKLHKDLSLHSLYTVKPTDGLTVNFAKWLMGNDDHAFSTWKHRMPAIESDSKLGGSDNGKIIILSNVDVSDKDTKKKLSHQKYLMEKYGNRWRCKILQKGVICHPLKLSASWLQPVLFNAKSRYGRQLACALIPSLINKDYERKRVMLDLLTDFLKYIGEAGEASEEFCILYRCSADEVPWRQYLALKGVLIQIADLLNLEIEKIHHLEETTLSSDLAQGFALRQYVELMAMFLEDTTIRQSYKAKLLGPVLQGYLSLRILVVQRTRLIDDAQEKLLEMLEEMTTGTEEETRAFMAVLIDTVRKTPMSDIKTPVFIFERLCSIIHPEENDVGEFFLTLEKDPQQEDFLQGRMLGNPYPSSESGLGPLMRDVKNKICMDCELVALLEDDNGMELLVNNKIISLDLPVKDVYKKMWLAEGGERDAMRIVYRMRGLLGDATEEFIETLSNKVTEEVDNEQLYRMANVLAECGGLSVMLDRIGSLQNFIRTRSLLQVILKLFLLAVKVRRCQEVLCQPELGAINTLLKVLQLCLQTEVTSDISQIPTCTEQLLEIMETILSKAASESLDSFLQFSLTFGGPEYVPALMTCTECGNVRHNPSVLRHLIRVLAALVYGNEIKMAILCNHFKSVLDFDKYDGSHEASDSFTLELFCVLTNQIEPNAIGGTLKDYIMGLGIVERAVNYINIYAPNVQPALLRTESDEMKEFISKPSLKYILRFLTGLVNKHEPTQLAVAKDIIPIIHRLEQISSDEHVGSLAENLLEALCTDENTAKRVQEVRDFTRAEKKRLAMATREKQLDALGMRTNEKGQVTAKGSILQKIEKLRDETGLTCFICREGYACQPAKVLGIYTFTKRIALDEYENKPRKTMGYTTVTHFNVVHIDCHNSAIRSARTRDEWEMASLQNANTRCNGLLPLWGPEVSEAAFATCISRQYNYLQESTQRCEITFTNSIHDLKLLLLRFALEKSFHEDAGGGGPQSNMHLVPYLLFYGLYTLLSARSINSREEKTLVSYLEAPVNAKWLECAYEVDGPLFQITLSLALHTPELWKKYRIQHMRRLLMLAHVRNCSPSAMKNFLTGPEKSMKDYNVYKPYLMMWILIDLIYKNFFGSVVAPKDEEWPLSLFDYIRKNDEAMSKSSDTILNLFTHEFLPCASFGEFCDFAELLHEIESPDEFVMDLLESMPDSAPTAPQ